MAYTVVRWLCVTYAYCIETAKLILKLFSLTFVYIEQIQEKSYTILQAAAGHLLALAAAHSRRQTCQSEATSAGAL